MTTTAYRQIGRSTASVVLICKVFLWPFSNVFASKYIRSQLRSVFVVALCNPMHETMRFAVKELNRRHPPHWDAAVVNRIATTWLAVCPADKTAVSNRVEWCSVNIIVTFHAKPWHMDEGVINSTIWSAPLPGTVKIPIPGRKAIIVWYAKSAFHPDHQVGRHTSGQQHLDQEFLLCPPAHSIG